MKAYVHGGDVYRHPDVLDFSANINPLGTPWGVIRAARESMDRIACYPDAAKEKLREKLACDQGVRPEWLMFGNGAAELIFSLVWAVRPRKALVLAPTFAEYEQALRGAGCQVEYCTLTASEGFLAGEKLLDRIRKTEPQLVFLCNPNNPTGLLAEPSLLRRLAGLCREKNILLAVDECFMDFVPRPEEHTLKPLLDSVPGLFLLKAFTKTYAMAGLRLGYGICSDPGLLQAMENRMQPWNVSIPAQEAGLAALEEGDYVKEARRLVFRESVWLKEQLKALGYPVYDSQANYIFFRGEETLGECLLKKQIMVRDCSNYRGLEKGYYRIAVRTRRENEALLAAGRKVREEWQKQS